MWCMIRSSFIRDRWKNRPSSKIWVLQSTIRNRPSAIFLAPSIGLRIRMTPTVKVYFKSTRWDRRKYACHPSLHPGQRRWWRSTISSQIQNIKFIEPVSYLDMLKLEKNAKAILTDSGASKKRHTGSGPLFYVKGRNRMGGNDRTRVEYIGWDWGEENCRSGEAINREESSREKARYIWRWKSRGTSSDY